MLLYFDNRLWMKRRESWRNVKTFAFADLELFSASLFRVLVIPKGSMLRKTKLTLVWKLCLSLWLHTLSENVNVGGHENLDHSPRVSLPSSPTLYFKLPYIGHFSVVTQKRVRHLIKRYCNDLDIKLVFSSFKIGNLFACAGCNACYVGETTRHFSTRVREHLVSDRASHIFKHLENSEHCRALCSVDCFHILDHASIPRFNLR